MIQEEKDLILKDLCARQPYNVKISVDDDNLLFIPRLKYIDGLVCHFYECAWTKFIDEIKPYLRSMSSMTEGEKKEYKQHQIKYYEVIYFDTPSSIDWLISKHFDLHHLIPMGLALEAPEGMYNN